MCLTSIANDKCHPVFIVEITALKTSRSVKINLLDRIGGLTNRISFTQFLFIVDFGIPRCRAYDLNCLGREFKQPNHFSDKLNTIDKDVEIVGQILL